MAKKIQISTIREVADVQVIRIDAAFVARVVETEMLAKDIACDLANLESGCTEDEPEAEIAAPTLTYWRMDLEKVHNLLQDIKLAFFREPNDTKRLTLEEAQKKVNYLLETGKTPEEIMRMDAKGEDFGDLDVSAYLNHLEHLANCR